MDDALLNNMDASWGAANYFSVGQIYLLATGGIPSHVDRPEHLAMLEAGMKTCGPHAAPGALVPKLGRESLSILDEVMLVPAGPSLVRPDTLQSSLDRTIPSEPTCHH